MTSEQEALRKRIYELYLKNISKLKKLSMIKKRTSIDVGISKFINWYKEYKKIK